MGNTYWLTMEWDYTYDKESTWIDNESGKERYELAEGARYPLPHSQKKLVEIGSVNEDGNTVTAEVNVDYSTYTVVSEADPIVAHASDSYSVCGDSVHLSWCLKFSIVKD